MNILEHFEPYKSYMKVGIVGSRKYQNKIKVKHFIFELKKRFDDNLIIVSGGQPQGADGFAKRFALELDVKYIEFPPSHYSYNQHCILPANIYNKDYKVWYFFERNTHIAQFSDKVIAFIPENIEIEDSPGTFDTYSKAIKLGKGVGIIK